MEDVKYNRPNKIPYYLQIAKAVCKRSTCLRRHYGAVIVKNDEIISTGYNGAPRGYPNCSDLGQCKRNELGYEKGSGYQYCPAVHSEQNAIISAPRSQMQDATIYIFGEESDGSVANGYPCNLCARLIVNSGIRFVIYSIPSTESNDENAINSEKECICNYKIIDLVNGKEKLLITL